jgi:hypothetical protein
MADLATIGIALGNIKTAMDIVKGIRDSGDVLEKAELKLRLADLVSALADVKTELVEVEDSVRARDRRITELEQAFESKEALIRQGDALYRIGQDGQPHGQPLCIRCWTASQQQRELVRRVGNHMAKVCPSCHTEYDSRSASTIN